MTVPIIVVPEAQLVEILTAYMSPMCLGTSSKSSQTSCKVLKPNTLFGGSFSPRVVDTVSEYYWRRQQSVVSDTSMYFASE